MKPALESDYTTETQLTDFIYFDIPTDTSEFNHLPMSFCLFFPPCCSLNMCVIYS